jgi:eukaryotic-like serine/threonine-protein kinase
LGPRDQSDPFVGRVIRGRYRVERQLGEGAMGTVYLAEQLSIRRKVALKILRADFARDENFVARFQQEARLVAALNDTRNPRVTFVHDFDQADDGSFFIVMEWLDGHALSEVIAREGALGLSRALRLATQIAEGLDAAHSAGVIHRDVKPHNIMVLTASDDIKLMDFGIARLRDSSSRTRLTQTGMMMGTPSYMAPEQIEGGEVTTAVDVYSFGIVFYEMLTGVVPFRANTSGAVLAKHLSEAPEPPSRRRPEITREIEALILTALEKDPAHRQGSMGEIVAVLRESARRVSNTSDATVASQWAPSGQSSEPAPLTFSATSQSATRAIQEPAEQAQHAPRKLRWVRERRGYVAAIAGSAVAAILFVASLPYFFGSQPAVRSPGPERSSKPVETPTGPDADVAKQPRVTIPGPTVALGAFHALVVGNSDYTAFRRLRTAVNDVEAVAALLADRYGFTVKLLRNATRQQIMSELHELRQRLTESDNLLIYYAGHGELDQESQRCYWLPVDSESEDTGRWISNADVRELLNLMAVKHLLIVADSCFTETTAGVAAGRAERMSQEELARALNNHGTTRARMVLTSGGMEPVLDSRAERISLFAQIFVDSLKENDGVLAGSALFQRIRLKVQAMPDRWTVAQRPQYGPIKFTDHNDGEFFFVRAGS